MFLKCARYAKYDFSSFSSPLVSVQYLKQNLNKVKVLDCSWYLPQMNRNAETEYKKSHIPGAIRFDTVYFNKFCLIILFDLEHIFEINEVKVITCCINANSLKESTLPLMLPKKEDFERSVSDMGISNKDQIVVYDGINIFSSSRVYWQFKYFGHQDIQLVQVQFLIQQYQYFFYKLQFLLFKINNYFNQNKQLINYNKYNKFTIAVLDGGFPVWVRENCPVSDAPPQIKDAKYKATPQAKILKELDFILKNIENQNKGKSGDQVLDARPASSFNGESGPSSGHMPYSTSLPYTQLIDEKTGLMKTTEEIKAILKSLNIDLNKNIVCSCEIGLTAAMIYVALERIGLKNISLYDGSWSEYSRTKNVEIKKK